MLTQSRPLMHKMEFSNVLVFGPYSLTFWKGIDIILKGVITATGLQDDIAETTNVTTVDRHSDTPIGNIAAGSKLNLTWTRYIRGSLERRRYTSMTMDSSMMTATQIQGNHVLFQA